MRAGTRRNAALAAASVMVVAAASGAGAQTAPWDLVVTSNLLLNTRTITLATVTPTVGTLNAVLAVQVTEAAKIADNNPWNVQVSVSDFTQTLDADGNAVTPQDAQTISRSRASISAPTNVDLGSLLNIVTSTPGTGGSFTEGGTEARTLFTISGQTPGVAYTNVYASTAGLAADLSQEPSLVRGTYRSTVTFTLGN